MTVPITNSHEVDGVIPHMLRFKPKGSFVFLPMGSDLPVARVDLPTTPRDRETVWRSIRDAYSRYSKPGSSLAIVYLTADDRDGHRRQPCVRG